jgi:peroxiredoxin
MSLRTIITIGIIAVVLVVGGFLIYPSSNSSSSGGAKVGSPVPAFSLTSLEGTGTVAVPQDGGGKGKPAILLFFAAWCTQCQEEMPQLAPALSNPANLGGASVLGIDALDQKTAAQNFVSQYHPTFPIGFDSIGAVTNGTFGFPALPEVVFVNGQGIITEIHYGATSPADLAKGVATFK